MSFYRNITIRDFGDDPQDRGNDREEMRVISMVFQALHHALASYARTLTANRHRLEGVCDLSEKDAALTSDVGISLPRLLGSMTGRLIRIHGARSGVDAVSDAFLHALERMEVVTVERTVRGNRKIREQLANFVLFSKKSHPVPENVRPTLVTRHREKGNSDMVRMTRRHNERGTKMPHPVTWPQRGLDGKKFPQFFVQSSRADEQGSRAFPIMIRQEPYNGIIPDVYPETAFSTYGLALCNGGAPSGIVPIF